MTGPAAKRLAKSPLLALHQLRHNAATELWKEFCTKAARIILRHHSAAVTEIYAEKDEQEAIEAIMKIG